ncbi:hypothetical protein QVD17_09246 [Tagetes erecta]|uniref:Uncharacterized protein n=1 Tax=Tagetes erecta TaxID=13708 RepID=A0AAD8KYZ9_TARER|nr:hypothetical protein QVD17_09246 [Tagetes erecta]
MIRGCPLVENYHLVVFREVTSFNIVIFRALLEFLAIPSLRRRETRKWIAVSRFISNAKVAPEGKLGDTSVNELRRLDATLLKYSSSKKKGSIPDVPKNLEVLEATLEGINSHLHLLSRRLITTRVSILNMVSFY